MPRGEALARIGLVAHIYTTRHTSTQRSVDAFHLASAYRSSCVISSSTLRADGRTDKSHSTPGRVWAIKDS